MSGASYEWCLFSILLEGIAQSLILWHFRLLSLSDLSEASSLPTDHGKMEGTAFFTRSRLLPVRLFLSVLLTKMFRTAEEWAVRGQFFFQDFRPEGNYEKLNLVGYLNDYCKEQPRNTCDTNSFVYWRTPCLWVIARKIALRPRFHATSGLRLNRCITKLMGESRANNSWLKIIRLLFEIYRLKIGVVNVLQIY